MKYYTLSELGRFNNLKIRSVIYDRERHWQFTKTVGRGMPCKDIDYCGLDQTSFETCFVGFPS